MLKMKDQCEKCQHKLLPDGEAFICSFECTFCHTCTEEMDHICPNCDGNLVIRPTRKRSVPDVAGALVKRKLKRMVGGE